MMSDNAFTKLFFVQGKVSNLVFRAKDKGGTVLLDTWYSSLLFSPGSLWDSRSDPVVCVCVLISRCVKLTQKCGEWSSWEGACALKYIKRWHRSCVAESQKRRLLPLRSSNELSERYSSRTWIFRTLNTLTLKIVYLALNAVTAIVVSKIIKCP